MEEDEEHTTTVKMETIEEDEEHTTVEIENIDIQCKFEIEEQTEIKVERESDSDEGSSDDSESDENSIETWTSRGIKRKKGNIYRNKKIKKKEEESDTDDDVEELKSNDPLDVSDELNDNDHTNTQIWEHFTRWQKENQLHGYTEDIFLTYFKDMETRTDPAALWRTYCALRAVCAGSADINRYHRLKYYIRKVTEGYRERESRVFTSDDINTFLSTASDDTHLAWKVAIIVGVTGGCRCNELRNLMVDDVKLYGNKALLHIQESSKKQRSYVISENYSFYIRKYLKMRPKTLAVKRLLVPCKYNEFSKRAMGMKKIGSIPTGVARFLNLPNADQFTGHSYRRTFALFNPLKQSNTVNSDDESDNDNETFDNNDIDNNQIDNLDNRTKETNRKMPAKIYKKFLEVHDVFKEWMKRMRVPYIFEDCVLTYFKELAKNYIPLSLWKLFTMLRYTLLKKEKLDIRSYKDVNEYLRGAVDAATPRTAGAFSARDVDMFVREAPDDTYLGIKVALLLGVCGACNCQELMNITVDNVRKYGPTIVVKIKYTNKKNKVFIIPDNYCDYIKKYMDLRPKNMYFDKFLIAFQHGIFTWSIMNKVMVRSVPRDVASYLKITNADEFTGHYLRRTAYVLFNLTTLTVLNDCDDSDNDDYESDNHNDNDNEVENSDNTVERPDKLIDKRSNHHINTTVGRNYIDNNKNDNEIENSDNTVERPDKLIDKRSNHSINTTVGGNCIDNKNCKVDAIDNENSKVDNKYSSLEDDLFEVTPDIVEDQCNIDNNSKPGWHPRYDEIYNYFMRWLEEKSTKTFSEKVVLIYFKELAEKFKPSTLWSQFYVLRRTLKIKNKVDISDYDELKDFLKKTALGFRCTKSRVFTLKQIDDFLEKAPDEMYLHWKVALILGIKGACQCRELLNLTTEQIKLDNNIITVKVQETKNRKRKFFISDHYFPYVKKYMDMRPAKCKTDRFLLLIKNKKVIKSCIGKNTINNMAKEIAEYLNLPFPEEYNGHCFRTTSMSLFSHDALVRSSRQAGQLSNAMEDFSKARNEAHETVRGKNEALEAGRGKNEAVRGKNEAGSGKNEAANGKNEAGNGKNEAGSGKNEAYEAGSGKNEAKSGSWPDDGKRALCWPLSFEKDDEFETDEANETSGEQLILNAENGIFERVGQNLKS